LVKRICAQTCRDDARRSRRLTAPRADGFQGRQEPVGWTVPPRENFVWRLAASQRRSARLDISHERRSLPGRAEGHGRGKSHSHPTTPPRGRMHCGWTFRILGHLAIQRLQAPRHPAFGRSGHEPKGWTGAVLLRRRRLPNPDIRRFEGHGSRMLLVPDRRPPEVAPPGSGCMVSGATLQPMELCPAKELKPFVSRGSIPANRCMPTHAYFSDPGCPQPLAQQSSRY